MLVQNKSEVTVNDIRTSVVREPSVIAKNSSLDDVMNVMVDDHRTRQVYVVDEQNRLEGTITSKSVIDYLFPNLSVQDNDYLDNAGATQYRQFLMACDIMKASPVCVSEDSSLVQTARLMKEENISELPVVNKNMELVGEVNILEIITYFCDKNNNYKKEELLMGSA